MMFRPIFADFSYQGSFGSIGMFSGQGKVSITLSQELAANRFRVRAQRRHRTERNRRS